MSEVQQFESAIGAVLWESGSESLRITMANREHPMMWHDVVGAGEVMLPQGSAPDALITAHLVIAPGAQVNYLLRIPLPEGDVAAQALVETVRSKLGKRWHAGLTATTYRAALIPAWSNLPDWLMPAVVLGFVGLSAIFLLVVLLFGMGSDSQLEVSWWQVGLGFAIWVGVVAAMLSLYKKLWIK